LFRIQIAIDKNHNIIITKPTAWPINRPAGPAIDTTSNQSIPIDQQAATSTRAAARTTA